MAEATRFETTKTSPDRVLIVEDEENARLGYEALLRRWGFEVLGVSSAEDALAKFSEFAPAVLIADVELHGNTTHSCSSRDEVHPRGGPNYGN